MILSMFVIAEAPKLKKKEMWLELDKGKSWDFLLTGEGCKTAAAAGLEGRLMFCCLWQSYKLSSGSVYSLCLMPVL